MAYQPTPAQKKVLEEMKSGAILWRNAIGPSNHTYVLTMERSTKKLNVNTVYRLYENGFINKFQHGDKVTFRLSSKGEEYLRVGVNSDFGNVL